MNFVSPQFLWAFTALSIPVIIHLFNFRRTTRIFFSNTRLLRQVKSETTRQRNIRKYWVLSSRLLFLSFLVLAFAQPFIPAKDQMSTGKICTIYLDNSFSMSAQVGQKIRALDAGSAYVREIAGLFPADARYKLITNDFAPFSNSFKTKSEILDLVSSIRLSPVSRTFDEVLQRIGHQSRADIFWISDFQRSTFGREKSLLKDSLNQWHIIPVDLGKTSNVFVDSLYLESPLMIGGEKNVIHATLHNSGARKIEGLIVKLTINDIQSATASAILEPNSATKISFELTSHLKNLNKARLNFNDFPVAFDNEFYFTLNLREKLNVLEIKQGAGESYVGKVYGNKQFFKFRALSAANMNYSLLDEADLVVLNGVDKIDAGLSAALLRYQAQFGSLLIIPGLHPDVEGYRLLTHYPLLKISEGNDMAELDKPDFQNPFFENVFEDRTSVVTMPRAKILLDWGADRSAILKFRTGKPFLSRSGNTFLMASPLDATYSDIYNQAVFVPVMYRLASAGKKVESRAYYTLGENLISVRADSLGGEEPLRLVGDQEIIPSQRRTADKILLEIPRFAINPGFYNVVHKRDTLDLIAFDLNRQESLLDQYSGIEIKSMLGGGKNVSLFRASSPEAFSNEIKARYLGIPLWRQMLALALFSLLAEVLLLRFLK